MKTITIEWTESGETRFELVNVPSQLADRMTGEPVVLGTIPDDLGQAGVLEFPSGVVLMLGADVGVFASRAEWLESLCDFDKQHAELVA